MGSFDLTLGLDATLRKPSEKSYDLFTNNIENPIKLKTSASTTVINGPSHALDP